MTKEQALTILTEQQKWRREMPPYDGEDPETHRPMPYTVREYGQALDVAIETLKMTIGNEQS